MGCAIRLGVNVDHVATIREARGTTYPDPVEAASSAIEAGADGITVHLREDRRHIQERDVQLLCKNLKVPLNLEMAGTQAMVEFALQVRPKKCCIVPEKRQELTTEGGLDVCRGSSILRPICAKLANSGIEVSLFIDPLVEQIEAAVELGVPVIELHTGTYAEAKGTEAQSNELIKLFSASKFATEAHLQVNAGHGLNYENVTRILSIPNLEELNIGHSIVARAMSTGIAQAVREMKNILRKSDS